MKIDLPIHKSPRNEVVLDREHTFLFYDEAVVGDVEHLDDTGRADAAFDYTGEETVSHKIIEPVHIELTANKLV